MHLLHMYVKIKYNKWGSHNNNLIILILIIQLIMWYSLIIIYINTVIMWSSLHYNFLCRNYPIWYQHYKATVMSSPGRSVQTCHHHCTLHQQLYMITKSMASVAPDRETYNYISTTSTAISEINSLPPGQHEGILQIINSKLTVIEEWDSITNKTTNKVTTTVKIC